MGVKIFNIYQANQFLSNGATAIGAGLGDAHQVYILFLKNEVFEELMRKWMAREKI